MFFYFLFNALDTVFSCTTVISYLFTVFQLLLLPSPQLDLLTLEADAITSLTYVFIVRVFCRPCVHTCALILHMMVHLCVVAVLCDTLHTTTIAHKHTPALHTDFMGRGAGGKNKVLSESAEVNLFRFHFGLNSLYLNFFFNFCPSSPRSCDPDRL